MRWKKQKQKECLIKMEEVDLSMFFHTKAQVNDFLVRLSNFSDEIYKTGFNAENSLANNFGLDKKDKLMIFLRNNNVNTSLTSDLKSFLDKLQEKIQNLPTLSITLAFEPNEETLNLLNEWFTINIKKQFIFDISVNPSLIAGVAINYNGKYLDFSVRQKVDKVIKDSLASQTSNASQSQQNATNVTLQN